VQLVPTLSSFTHQRHEIVPGTAELRLDFFEAAASKLAQHGVRSVFRERVSDTSYLADWCPYLPFETIVKNVACGSTIRKYPGLFDPGHRFQQPVVKFDYRIDPEDQPLPDDYVVALGHRVDVLRRIALDVNGCLQTWLEPLVVLDFCLIFGFDDASGEYTIVSEISPDAMRIRDGNGAPLDKDLFREGAGADAICSRWRSLVDAVRSE
jgi:phosphoribosylaminoimidazole-succinocarboxamide synthase